MKFIKIIITLVILIVTANAEVKFQVSKNGIINIIDDKIKMEVTTKIENMYLYHKINSYYDYILVVNGVTTFYLTEKEYNDIKRELLNGTF